ncbi:MAG TPA: DNA polymerase, partial [Verrucomicrobiae bacterium]|nr:DNA polymerase [Verrucomicrobiae bacterium]
MSRKEARKLWAIDCETDPFKHGRVPEPFIWGAWDGSRFLVFDETQAFVAWAKEENAYLYAHNGGKFDFMFLLPYLQETKAKIIKSRIVEINLGCAKLRDSYAIIPVPLAAVQKSEIDYWKMELNCRKEHWSEIVSYLKSDCVNLFNLVTEYRRQAGKGLTIAGNAMTYVRSKLNMPIQKTNAKFDEKFRPFYFGGRCEAWKTGEFETLDIFDINSSYPYAMTFDHAHGSDYIERPNWSRLDAERLQRCFFSLTCDSNGAFPQRDKFGLHFPIGRGDFRITGWEFVEAIRHDLIKNVHVHECLEFYDTLNFSSYVSHWHRHKQAADKSGDKINRTIGKIMMNSLYGKFAQNPINYKDYKVVEIGTPREDGWHIEAEVGDLEIHSRPTLWELQKKHGEDWRNFPKFFNVATGASITGFARARLLSAACEVGRDNIVYMDTDCLFIVPGGNLDALPRDDNLGSWNWEGRAAPAYVAGKKLYAAHIVSGPKKGTKIACKGGKLTATEIKRITKGEKIEWKNPAPTFHLDGTA